MASPSKRARHASPDRAAGGFAASHAEDDAPSAAAAARAALPPPGARSAAAGEGGARASEREAVETAEGAPAAADDDDASESESDSASAVELPPGMTSWEWNDSTGDAADAARIVRAADSAAAACAASATDALSPLPRARAPPARRRRFAWTTRGAWPPKWAPASPNRTCRRAHSRAAAVRPWALDLSLLLRPPLAAGVQGDARGGRPGRGVGPRAWRGRRRQVRGPRRAGGVRRARADHVRHRLPRAPAGHVRGGGRRLRR